MSTLSFTKMQGCGNDYIYIDCFRQQVEDPAALAVKLSDRHKGIGGDGVILICPAEAADAKMRMFNLDGSEGNMCGNGIRCVAKYVVDRGIARGDTVRIETRSGVKTCQVHRETGLVTVDMGEAEFSPEDVPVRLPGKQVVDRRVQVAGGEYPITCVSMGNPHCVVFGGDPEELDLPALGPRFEHDPPVPPGGEHGVYPGARPPHIKNAGVGAGQRGDPGLRHRGLRQRGGGHRKRLLPSGGGRHRPAAGRGADHPGGGPPGVDDRGGRHRISGHCGSVGGREMQKFIFVTGGVVSGLGKGITAASLGRLLKARGLKVAAQKLDPYINVDPGTMSPYQHGEVYVTEDGLETDLDLGHYERFIDEDLNKFSNLTTGRVYWNVLNKERRGGVPGGDGAGHPPHHLGDQKLSLQRGPARRGGRGDFGDRGHRRGH